MTRRRLPPAVRAATLKEYLAYVPGRGYGALGKKYGIGASTVRDLVTGRVAP